MTNQSEPIYWLEIAKAYGPVLIGLLGIIFAYFTNLKVLKSRETEAERAEIYKKLNDFYGPFQQLKMKNERLHDILKQGRDFRMLNYLLDGKVEQLSQNDKVLLEQIIEINTKLDSLIVEKGGLIDDAEIKVWLNKLTTHYRIIDMAYNGKIKGEIDRFTEYVYPLGIDDAIKKYIDKLQGRLSELNNKKKK